MSADLNHVVLIGRLTRDAELKYLASGTAVCKFALAVNRRVKKGDQWTEEASFIDVTAWGKTGEGIAKYLLKGKQVAVDGELRQERWEQDGQKRSRVEVVANSVQLLGGGTQSDGGFQQARQPGSPASYQAPAQDAFEDAIPF